MCSAQSADSAPVASYFLRSSKCLHMLPMPMPMAAYADRRSAIHILTVYMGDMVSRSVCS